MVKKEVFMNTNILRSLSYGVYVVSTQNGEKSTGCIANSLMQITHDTIAVSINHQNYTNECIRKSKKFAISVLGVDVEDNIIPVFGFQSGHDVEKFSGVKTVKVKGIDVIENSVGYIVCELVNLMETETHTVFLGKIVDGEILHEQIPMTYAYYHAVKKGSSPKSAPTYIEEKATTKLAYRCKICGYIYEGDITKEPETYVCPICKKGKEFFEKI
jgi:flavin reductase (DIM6/NTAB) family NADH-FMN oxidoreductase RutF/rubredoxin